MDIYKKIEEIRQKPEHIRLRYVWGLVAICMVFIIAIWIFSFWSGRGTSFENEKVEIFDDFSQKKRTLDEYKTQLNAVNEDLKSVKDGIQNTGGQTESLESSQENNSAE